MNKEKVVEFIRAELNDKRQSLLSELEALVEDKARDTKSSAGDKFETSTEMINQSENLIRSRLSEINNSLKIVNSLDGKSKGIVELGSLVKTDKCYFFFGLNIPKFNYEDQMIIPITFASPIGKEFLNKNIEDEPIFNGIKYKILNIQ